jgi:hypothetical protein
LPLRLFGAVGDTALVHVAPLLFAVAYRGIPQVAGALAWAMTAIVEAPTLRLHRRPLAAGRALPVVAVACIVLTVESTLQYWRGPAGYWKGRFWAPACEAR